MKKFNVMTLNSNRRELVSYDVIPYFINEYTSLKVLLNEYPDDMFNKLPVNREELMEFIRRKSLYAFSNRHDYEIIISDWPNTSFRKKIDIHYQIMMNIDLITDIVGEELGIK